MKRWSIASGTMRIPSAGDFDWLRIRSSSRQVVGIAKKFAIRQRHGRNRTSLLHAHCAAIHRQFADHVAGDALPLRQAQMIREVQEAIDGQVTPDLPVFDVKTMTRGARHA